MHGTTTALALQGGGSHGAYTWGVLDRLLEDGRTDIEAISGASAGAINAAVLASGYASGGCDGARESLDSFWTAVSESMNPHAASSLAPTLANPATKAFLSMTRYLSPYQLNPLNVNPLRDILAEQVDFDRLREANAIKLFISATRVRDASLRIFTNEDLTLDALLASACIPAMHHTVEVEGEAYWDGGLTANPPLSSLVYQSNARELLIVLLNPGASDDVPSTADAILERFTQISFSSTLSAELQAIGLAKAEAERGRRFCVGRVDRRLRALNIQVIESPGYMSALDPASRYRTDSTFTAALRDEGRKAAEVWLLRERGARPLHPSDTSMRGVIDASGKSECPTG